MKQSVRYILSVIVTLSACICYAQDAETLYADKNYDRALQEFKRMEQQNGSSAALYYDMGNTYYQMEDYGQAILYYRMALTLDPYMSQAKNNLAFVQQKVMDRNQAEMKDKKGSIQPEQPSFFQSIYKFIAVNNSSNLWAWCAFVCFALFVAGVLLYVIPRSVLLKKIGFFGGIGCLICFVFLIAFSFMAASPNRFDKTAIVKDNSVKLLSEPRNDAKEVTTPLTKGTEMLIKEQQTDAQGTKWSLVHLNSSNEGWVPDSVIYTFPTENRLMKE